MKRISSWPFQYPSSPQKRKSHAACKLCWCHSCRFFPNRSRLKIRAYDLWWPMYTPDPLWEFEKQVASCVCWIPASSQNSCVVFSDDQTQSSKTMQSLSPKKNIKKQHPLASFSQDFAGWLLPGNHRWVRIESLGTTTEFDIDHVVQKLSFGPWKIKILIG